MTAAPPTARTRRRPPRRAGTVAVLVVAALLLLGAVALLAGSFLSYATVKHRLDAFASDHDADLSRARFDGIVRQLRAGAALLAVAAGGAYARRRGLGAALDALGRSVRDEAGAAARAARRAVAAESRLHATAFGAVVAAAVVVRLEFLFQPMRYDEAVTVVHYASRPLYIGLTAYTAPNNHVLNTVLVHLTTAVFGDRPWAARLPALVAGVLLVPATYVAARLLYGRAAALVAAALVATSSTLVEYSTNARGYTLVALCTVTLVALATRLRSSSSPAGFAAFALVAALGLWTIPIMVYAIVAVSAWLVWIANGRLVRVRLLGALVAATALAAVLYAPILATAGPHALGGNSFVAPRTLGYVAHHLPSSLAATFARWHRDQPAPLWIVLAAGFVVACVLHRRIARVPVPPAAGALAIVPLVLAQRVVPFERVWLFLVPLYLATAAAGVVAVARLARFEGVTAVVAVALAAGLAGDAVASRAVARSEDTSTFRDAPAVAAVLERVVRPGDRVLAAPPADAILEYYLDTAGLDGGTLLYGTGRPAFAVVKEGPDDYPLPVVLSWRGPLRGVRAVPLRRFPHAVLYRLERR